MNKGQKGGPEQQKGGASAHSGKGARLLPFQGGSGHPEVPGATPQAASPQAFQAANGSTCGSRII